MKPLQIDHFERAALFTEPIEKRNDFLQRDNLAIARRKHFGMCLMCGQEVLFALHSANLRETVKCPRCGSFNRQRQLIAVLSYEAIGKVLPLPQLVKKLHKGTRILLLESVTNFAAVFEYYAGNRVQLDLAEYIDGSLSSGERTTSHGVLHLDIENTHYEDAEFDYILHADVFEHVADAPRAEKEQLRILKKKGAAVYTAPFHSQAEHDDIRATLENGKVVHHAEPIYHGDPSPGNEDGSGCLVYRIFSFPDMRARHEALGAEFDEYYLYSGHYGILGNNGFVHVARKR